MRRILAQLLAFVRPYRWLLACGLLLALALAGIKTARVVLIMPFWDEVVAPQMRAETPAGLQDWLSAATGAAPENTGDDGAGDQNAGDDQNALAAQVREALPRLLLATLFLSLAFPLVHFGQNYLAHYLLGRVLVDIRRHLCAKLLALPLGFHTAARRGDVLSRVLDDVQRAHLALELMFVHMLPALLLLAAGIGTLFWISWWLALTLLLVGPLLAGIFAYFGRRIRKNAQRRQESQGEVTQRLLQILAGIKVVKAFNAAHNEQRAFGGEALRFFRRNMRVVKFGAAARSAVEGVTYPLAVVALMLGFGAVLAGFGGLTMGQVFAFSVILPSACYHPLKHLSYGWTELQETLPSARRFFALLARAPEAADAPDALPLHSPPQYVRMEDVHFEYAPGKPVLRGINLEARAGETIAIVGRTGAGKSTLADVLLRFHEPQRGRVLIDGVDLRRIKRAAWLSHVAVVLQEPFLFGGTLRGNILYGRPEAGEAEFLAAARAAHVEEFALRLPQGWETQVGDAGARLSGGQRQRIAIARALLRDPRVLIFDEATSALDARSEAYIQDALAALLRGRTVFVIAHRLSTVQRADRIVVLDEGRLAAQGTHAELLAGSALYAELMALQRGA